MLGQPAASEIYKERERESEMERTRQPAGRSRGTTERIRKTTWASRPKERRRRRRNSSRKQVAFRVGACH